ncbi:MAG TPA: GNAT family N-acetyltransferase [Aliidongia sp.]|uniref:GNAT family N-acetyltransferase n=1 Tax=Aliidongia sp. TaxID=1914230 RepID=UPI002DDD67CA|nr:GNAT family N-acetyltransferase [Aliidongia sp.]HEV2678206.1 GNAT family N-acetyltransferase [Aliidongia sp.]
MPDASATDIAATLASALGDDPFYWSITEGFGDDEAARTDCLDRYFRLSLAEGHEVGRVVIAGDDGAAIWVPPGDEAVLAAARARKHAAFADLLGAQGFSNYRRIIDFMDANLVAGIAESAWYLSILGVATSARGRGLGGRLLAPTLAEADTQGAACYLETFNPLSLPFYGRHGFRPSEPIVEPVTGAPYWAMVRAEKSS